MSMWGGVMRRCREEILPDSSRSGPFDMYQYTR
jgi:hypothetical protein